LQRAGIELSNPTQERRGHEVGRVARWPIAAVWLVLALGFVALWVSGFEPLLWWRAREQAAIAKAVPPHRAPVGPISIVQPTPLGTDSSVSRAPLPLHLVATRLGRNNREGYADIGVNVVSPQTYKAGAILANGARLAEIYADSVVLEHKGERLRLYLDGTGPAARETTVLSPIATVGGTAPIPSARADSYEALTEVVRIAPVFAGGRVRALELYPGTHSDLFGHLGFEPGDQIVAIDGTEIKDVWEALAGLRQLTAGVALILTIEREGKRQSLAVDGSLLRPGNRG